VCGIARGVEIGVDVEDRQRRPVERALVPRYCSPSETDDIAAHGEGGWHDRFLEYWTLKEAYLKARGLGIAVPLADVSFALNGDRAHVSFRGDLAGTDPNWTFSLFRPSPRYVGAVATTGAGTDVHEFV
jgi:4'-phosphopantetheinyl transferase